MQSQQFKIEAWEFKQPVASLSPRHQLKALQQIITKAKSVRRPLQIQIQPKCEGTQDLNSFLSLKANHRKYHTEQIYRNNSSAQVKHLAKKPQIKKTLLQLSEQSKIDQQMFQNIFKLRQKQSPSNQIAQKSPKYKLQYIKNINLKPKQKVMARINQIDNQKQQKLANNRVINQLSRIRRYQNNLSSDQCLVVFPNFEKKTLSINKSFFIQTIHKLVDTKSIGERIKINSKSKKQQSPENSKKWKHMIEKSNRRKKQLQGLFKTRPLFGKKQIQRRILASNLSKVLEQQSKKAFAQRLAKNEFDDDSLYCPWSYREQRLVQHLQSKKNK